MNARPVDRGHSYRVPEQERPQGPIPELRVLQWVAPVAQAQRRGDIEVSILSIEAYDDGFVLNVRIDHASSTVPRMPELRLAITDDAGAHYHARQPGGFGGGGHARMQWRSVYFFSPALGRNVQELRIEAPELRWFAHDDATQQLVPTEPISSLWVFSLDLGALPRQRAS